MQREGKVPGMAPVIFTIAMNHAAHAQSSFISELLQPQNQNRHSTAVGTLISKRKESLSNSSIASAPKKKELQPISSLSPQPKSNLPCFVFWSFNLGTTPLQQDNHDPKHTHYISLALPLLCICSPAPALLTFTFLKGMRGRQEKELFYALSHLSTHLIIAAFSPQGLNKILWLVKGQRDTQ